MTRLDWDKSGDRYYETGVDRGVLYLPNGRGIPWNGLTSIEEVPGEANTDPYYIDGVKYDQDRSVGDYSAVLSAYTYPDEFLEFDGYQMATSGFFLDDQPVNARFGLSYRTRIGNALQTGTEEYKIHVVYNLTATPSNRKYVTLGRETDPLEFSWDIVGIPEQVPGYRPTTHAVIDSRYFSPTELLAVENVLYGETDKESTLPPLGELMQLMSDLNLKLTIHADGSWTAEGTEKVVRMLDDTSFEINWPNASYLSADTFVLSDEE